MMQKAVNNAAIPMREKKGFEKVRNTGYILCVYIRTIVYVKSDDRVVSIGTSGIMMEREYAADGRVDRVTMRDGMFFKANIFGSACASCMKT
jgi:hypothetical protein